MKHSLTSIVSASVFISGALFTSPVNAAEYLLTISNLTRGIYFTPLLVAAHNRSASLFTAGETASAGLQAMAEGGDISGLVADLQSLNATIIENPAAGLLGPGATTTATLNTDGSPDNILLSTVAMMLPTNDGFVGLNSVMLPSTVGESLTYQVDAYDAGTEANDEVRGSGAPGMPGFPAPGPIDTASGNNATGINSTAESFIHIHRNVLGDFSSADGISDIDATVHRWLNPVARFTVELISE
jgi:hypothetical protein